MASDATATLATASPAAGVGAKLVLPQPYLLFLGDGVNPSYAKTAFGLRDWARDKCLGEFSCGGGTLTAGLPRLTPDQAKRAGAKSMVIGIANEGGDYPPGLDGRRWCEAVDAGLDLVSGHAQLG